MIKDIFALLTKFIRTEIITILEIITWLAIKNTDFYLMLWNTNYVRPAMTLGLISIPVISALIEYKENKREINKILSNIKIK